MNANPFEPSFHRRSIRLPGYDYSEVGSYFVTLVTYKREHLFGEVVEEHIQLSPEGEIVQSICEQISTRFPMVNLDFYVIMPNHFHGIITITPGEDLGVIDSAHLVRAIHPGTASGHV